MTGDDKEDADFPLPLDLPPMEARLVDDLPVEPGWQFEPKWDGFHCRLFAPAIGWSCVRNLENRSAAISRR